MKKTKHYLAFVAAIACVLPTWTASAGEIAIETGEGNVTALLQRDANAFADAVGQALLEMRPAPKTSNVFAQLRSKVQGATLARIEYTYEKDGMTMTRVYHGRSGHSLRTMIERASRKEDSTSSGSESTQASSSGGIDIPEADDIARDAAEDKYYPGYEGSDIRAQKLPEETSRLEATSVDSLDHSWDAELKTLRRIEADIDGQVVPAGGRITGYVSKTVCESCREVIRTFAEVYDAEGTIYQLIEPAAGSIVTGPSTAITRSMAASRELLGARKAYAKTTLSPATDRQRRATSRNELRETRRLEQAEVEVEDPSEEPCS